MDLASASLTPPGPGKTVTLSTDFPGKYTAGMRIAVGNESLSGGTFFTVEGVLREEYFAAGRYRDATRMGIFQRDFLAAQPQ